MAALSSTSKNVELKPGFSNSAAVVTITAVVAIYQNNNLTDPMEIVLSAPLAIIHIDTALPQQSRSLL